MKFEEILPALKEGKKIKMKAWPSNYCMYLKDGSLKAFIPPINEVVGDIDAIDTYDLLDDNWEIVKEKKKVKLRDLTEEQYKAFVDDRCGNQIVGIGCVDCPFYRVSCLYGKDNKCWIDNKDLYSDKFLDQEIEIEE